MTKRFFIGLNHQVNHHNLNFAFGTLFFTSTGRCIKGLYFTLQKIPDDFPKKSWS
jgi:hypothetical protein